MNLFEQQAVAMRPSPARAPAATIAPVGAASPMLGVMRFIEGASLEQCGKVALHLSARLFALEKLHCGMAAASLNEAAHFVADAALDIDGALRRESEPPCRCGRCDDCVAARSDEHFDRKRDALAA